MDHPIINALQWRYAVKEFDAAKKVSEDDIRLILESGRLAPSSFGVEAWKFLVIQNSALRDSLRKVAYDQTKVTDASHLILITRRTDVREHIVDELIVRTAAASQKDPSDLDGLRQMVQGAISFMSDADVENWARCQAYIPLGMMVQTAAQLEVDSCPMEGFDKKAVDDLLGLASKQLASVAMLALGYRGSDSAAMRPKVRRPFEEVVEVIV